MGQMMTGNRKVNLTKWRGNKQTGTLPQFDGHFEKKYTMNLKGVSNEKEAGIYGGV
jgi:hypothetical protein